jgi:hypothetical protein
MVYEITVTIIYVRRCVRCEAMACCSITLLAAWRRTFSSSCGFSTRIVSFDTNCVIRSAAVEMLAFAPSLWNNSQSSIPSAIFDKRIEPKGLPPGPVVVRQAMSTVTQSRPPLMAIQIKRFVKLPSLCAPGYVKLPSP